MNAKQIAQGEGELFLEGGVEWKSCIFAKQYDSKKSMNIVIDVEKQNDIQNNH